MTSLSSPIGVFDSGVGGLTVYRALREALPHEDFIYLGDTARLPYGTRSKEAIEQYTVAAARHLQTHGVKFLVVACNTVSAQALDALQREVPSLPYCGVIAAGAEAAVKATKNGRVSVLATAGTVRSGIYGDIIRNLKSDAQVQMLACGVLVALAEEGWCEGAEAEAVVSRYLSSLTPGYDTLVLGCTHFPLLMPVFRKLCPPDIAMIDSGAATAQAVAKLIAARKLANPQQKPGADSFFVTDMPDRFGRLATQFLGREIADKVMETGISVRPLENAADTLR